ncbi:MAG: hypothetical protein ACI856_002115 [Kiritimatiellia bacterium]|jgi:hypothetical protein
MPVGERVLADWSLRIQYAHETAECQGDMSLWAVISHSREGAISIVIIGDSLIGQHVEG